MIRMPTKNVFRLTVSILPLFCLSIAGLAQKPAAPSPVSQSSDAPAATLKMQVREVALPVTFRDKHGALVTTLQKSDFSLTEDGRAQTIKSFSHETNQPFRVGLLADTSRSMSGAMDAERKAAGKRRTFRKSGGGPNLGRA